MKAQFKFLSGARAGQVETFEKAYLGLGRHPLSDVRFDTERDLDVSARHAAVLKRPEGYVLQDLGSKNGTYVNGERLGGDRLLADGDVIGFGAKGPALEFHLLLDATMDRSTAGAEALAARVSQPRQSFPAVPPPSAPAPPKARSSTAVRIAAEVARQTRQLRTTTKILMGTLAGVVVLAGFVLWKGAQDRQHELQRIQAWADSVAAAARSREQEFQNQVEGLKAAYTQSLAEVERLRGELKRGGDPATVLRLRRELEAVGVRQQGILGAASVDYRAISTGNENAVAIVVVDRGNRDIVSGTAFTVDSQATFVTNKHVLVGEDGDKTPLRIVVKFSGSSQWFRGRLIGVADSADIGVFKVDGLKGGSPRVEGIERDPHTLQRGDPVAIIGYPLGMDLPMPGQGTDVVAEPSLTVGTASKVLSNVIQVDGYGAPGSSGSPIFDRNGHVVAVLYGGVTESNGKIILAVPVTAVVDYLVKLGITVR